MLPEGYSWSPSASRVGILARWLIRHWEDQQAICALEDCCVTVAGPPRTKTYEDFIQNETSDDRPCAVVACRLNCWKDRAFGILVNYSTAWFQDVGGTEIILIRRQLLAAFGKRLHCSAASHSLTHAMAVNR